MAFIVIGSLQIPLPNQKCGLRTIVDGNKLQTLATN